MFKTYKNGSDKPLAEVFDQSCFGFMSKSTKNTHKHIKESSKPLNQPISAMSFQKTLTRPLFNSQVLICEYLAGQNSWDQFVKKQDIVGILGKFDQRLMPLHKDCWIHQISKNSQINSLAHIRPGYFSFIFSMGYNAQLLKQILKSKQIVTIQCKTDQNLIELVNLWEKTIFQEATRKGLLARRIIPKLKVQINLVNQQYYVSINSQHTNIFVQGLKQLNLKWEEDEIIFNQIRKYITADQYWELLEYQHKNGLEFKKCDIIEFLQRKGLLLGYKSNKPSPSSINAFSSHKFIQSSEDIQSKSREPEQDQQVFSSSDEGSVFDLHKMDRYEGIQDDTQILEIVKEKKYRTKSCSLKPNQNNSFDQLWERFILE